jgi:hypothetical protein
VSARGALQVGRVVTSATTGALANLVPRDCSVLGFWANATTTIVVQDNSGTTGGTTLVNITACAVGWNPLPIDMVNGLTVNQAAQVWFSIA